MVWTSCRLHGPASPVAAEMSAQSWCQALNAPGRTILFAACDSPESLAAFAWSRANLLRQQDTLVLVHAYEKDRVFGGFNCLEEGKRVVAKFENLCRERDVSFRVVLAQGCPVKVITAAALGNKCDLCVMGSRGLSAVKRALYGSVSFCLALQGLSAVRLRGLRFAPLSPSHALIEPNVSCR
jgi:nucleotide-binding universal stress UspA family protein